MDKRVKAHFKKVDPILYEALTRIGDLEVMVTRVPEDHFSALCRAIIAQQLSTKVAWVIFERFRALFPKQEIF